MPTPARRGDGDSATGGPSPPTSSASSSWCAASCRWVAGRPSWPSFWPASPWRDREWLPCGRCHASAAARAPWKMRPSTAAARIAWAYRNLFNGPEAMAIVRGLKEKEDGNCPTGARCCATGSLAVCRRCSMSTCTSCAKARVCSGIAGRDRRAGRQAAH